MDPSFLNAPDEATKKRIMALTGRVRALLAGNDSIVVGAALADLTATWLACHYHGGDDKAETDAWREELLAIFNAMVRDLIEPNYHLYVEPRRTRP